MATIQTFRQILVIAGLTCCCISDGFIFGQMSGMTDALRGSDKSINLTEEDISWIASTINVTCVSGFFVVGVLSKIFGRRYSISSLCAPLLVCWVILYFVRNKILLLCTRVIVGVSFGGVALLISVCVVEYLSPNIRQHCFALMSSVGTQFGVTLGHVLCLLINWRTVALIGIVPTGLSLLLPFFWIESPSWLATRGKYKESEEAFWALNSSDPERDSEIKQLIAHEKLKQRDLLRESNSSNSNFAKFVFACKHFYYWKIIIIGVVIGTYRAAAGRILLSTLAITMIQEITEHSDILFYTLLVDGFGILGGGMSCYLVKKFSMRGLLFTSGTIANVLLILMSISLYAVPNEAWYPWIKISLMASYYIVALSGPYPVLEVVLAEIHPLEIKEFSIFVIGGLGGTIQFLWIKLAGTMFNSIGYFGTFFLNGVIVFFCIAYLWFFMPETKGRTLQDIELFFRNGKFSNPKELEKRCNNNYVKDLTSQSDIR